MSFFSYLKYFTLLALLIPAVDAQTCNTGTIPATTPDSRFIIHTDGTVTDTMTGLMWQRCSLGQTWDETSSSCTGSTNTYTWQQALMQAEANTLADYTDWSLPNIKELSSIVEEQCHSPAINLTVFPDTPSISVYNHTWSSSHYAGSSNRAWLVYFGSGLSGTGSKDFSNRVRLVRARQ